MEAPVEYPYRFCGVTAHPLRYGQHCKITEYDSFRRGWVTVQFEDGSTVQTQRLTVRLREQYKREECAPSPCPLPLGGEELKGASCG